MRRPQPHPPGTRTSVDASDFLRSTCTRSAMPRAAPGHRHPPPTPPRRLRRLGRRRRSSAAMRERSTRGTPGLPAGRCRPGCTPGLAQAAPRAPPPRSGHRSTTRAMLREAVAHHRLLGYLLGAIFTQRIFHEAGEVSANGGQESDRLRPQLEFGESPELDPRGTAQAPWHKREPATPIRDLWEPDSGQMFGRHPWTSGLSSRPPAGPPPDLLPPRKHQTAFCGGALGGRTTPPFTCSALHRLENCLVWNSGSRTLRFFACSPVSLRGPRVSLHLFACVELSWCDGSKHAT